MDRFENYIDYEDVQKKASSSSLRRSEVPVEYAVSLPMPTLRAGRPGFAFFAAPAVREPGVPMRQGAPDRWWVSDARNGQTLVFAHCAVHPFTLTDSFETETLPRSGKTPMEMQAALAGLVKLMTAVTQSYFDGVAGDPDARRETSNALQAIIPAPLLPQYRALAPDFFTWLEA